MINGIDAMKEVDGPRELTVKSQHAEKEGLVVSVTDTGVGLPGIRRRRSSMRSLRPNRTAPAWTSHQPVHRGIACGRLWAADNSHAAQVFVSPCLPKPTPIELCRKAARIFVPGGGLTLAANLYSRTA